MSLPTYLSVFAQCSSYPQGFSTRFMIVSFLWASPLRLRRVDFGQRLFAFGRCAPLERTRGCTPRLGGADPPEQLLRDGDRGGRHAEFGQAEADEQREERGIGGHFAADRDGDAGGGGGADERTQHPAGTGGGGG